MRKPTTLELAILGLLCEEPRTGYAVRRVFETTPMAYYSSSPGSIYPALRRLERGRLVAARKAPSGRGRDPRTWAATAAGRRVLLGWAASQVTRDDAVRRPDELMLRFAFVPLAGTASVRRFLSAYRREMRAARAEIAAYLRDGGRALDRLRRLAVRHGLESCRANERWAERALRELGETGGETAHR